jgi:hypothetical protein
MECSKKRERLKRKLSKAVKGLGEEEINTDAFLKLSHANDAADTDNSQERRNGLRRFFGVAFGGAPSIPNVVLKRKLFVLTDQDVQRKSQLVFDMYDSDQVCTDWRPDDGG